MEFIQRRLSAGVFNLAFVDLRSGVGEGVLGVFGLSCFSYRVFLLFLNVLTESVKKCYFFDTVISI